MVLVVSALVALCLLSAVVSVFTRVFGDVGRARVERFAARQSLAVTADNGSSVIRYLATTRRWRGALLCLAVLGFVWMPLATRQGVGINGLAAFGGWFVGAVIAEWRVDGLARGPQATALLRVRRLTDYVGRGAVVLVVLVWIVVGALGVTALVVSLGRSVGRPAAAVTLLAGALVVAIIGRVVQRILERPQPLAAVDLVEADNAIRGRSLHVLLGSALAIGGYLIAVSVDQVAARDEDAVRSAVFLVGYLVLPAMGIVVARRSWASSRPMVDARDDR